MINPSTEVEMIDEVASWVAFIPEKMTVVYSREHLYAELCDLLRKNATDELRVIEDADNGDWIADAALCKVYAEKVNHREEPSIHLTSYAIKALERGPVKRKAGRVWYDTWWRDRGIACLVFFTIVRFNLKPTRNREQADRGEPSACSIVAAALVRHLINVSERTVENLWARLQGDVGRGVLTSQI